MKERQNVLRWLFCVFSPKLPIFLLSLPFVFLMRVLRPIIWIRLIPVMERIGHGLGGTEAYLIERRAGLDSSNTVDIFYPDRPWKCNRQMIKMWKRLLPLYDLVYWIAWADKEIPGWEPHHFPSPSSRDINGLLNDTPPPVSFTRKEEDRGAVLLRDMGIPPGSQIICFHARDNAYLNRTWPQVDWTYHNYRDVDVNTYVLAIKELVARGYYCIRMGSAVNQDFLWKNPHVIDYAMGSWKSDFADMYLISRCHFFMGNSCGLDEAARFFKKQWVVVNLVPLKFISAWSPHYLFILKKLWLIREKRFLTFKEVINSEVGMYGYAMQYKKYGLEIVNNTPEEILDVIIEKEERISGRWRTNDEYEDLQRRFWELFKPDEFNQVFRSRVGSKFLLQNRGLL